MLTLYSYVCALLATTQVSLNTHLHTVTILHTRVIAISYDLQLHAPLNTLVKYSLQLV